MPKNKSSGNDKQLDYMSIIKFSKGNKKNKPTTHPYKPRKKNKSKNLYKSSKNNGKDNGKKFPSIINPTSHQVENAVPPLAKNNLPSGTDFFYKFDTWGKEKNLLNNTNKEFSSTINPANSQVKNAVPPPAKNNPRFKSDLFYNPIQHPWEMQNGKFVN